MTSGAGGYVSVTGTVAQASQAFGVSFANYTDVSGQTARAPVAAATTPSSVASDVLAVSGLDTGSHEMKPGDTLPPPGPNYWVAPPTSTYYGSKIAYSEPTANGQHQPWTVGGYTPQQIRGAYNVSDSGMTGRGQTVAIVDAYASPTMLPDANEFSRVTGTGHSALVSTSSICPLRSRSPRTPNAAPRAGTARRRSTSSPYTTWRRTPTSLRRRRQLPGH